LIVPGAPFRFSPGEGIHGPQGHDDVWNNVLLFFAVIYVYMALALMTIARRRIPRTAGSPGFQSPIFPDADYRPEARLVVRSVSDPAGHIVIFIIVWMAIAEARHKPNWWGILMLVPWSTSSFPAISPGPIESSWHPEGSHAFPHTHSPPHP